MANNQFFYSPAENHLAIIYTDRSGRDRFKGFVTEHEQFLLGPRKLTHRYVLKEFNLGPRTAHIFLSNVQTADNVHLELELKVFYRVDPRDAAPENLIQVVKMPNAGFESIICTNTEEKVRNEVFVQYSAEEIFSYAGRKSMRKALSSRIAERVRGFGITVNPLYGAAIMNVQPNEIYQRAMQEESAANAQGNAALKRVTPPLAGLSTLSAEQALQLLYTQIASAVTKTGNMPAHLYNYHNGENHSPEQGFQVIKTNIPEGPQPKKEKSDKQYPFAAD